MVHQRWYELVDGPGGGLSISLTSQGRCFDVTINCGRFKVIN